MVKNANMDVAVELNEGFKKFLSRNWRFIFVLFLPSFLTLLSLAYLLVPTTYTVRAAAVVEPLQSQTLFGVFGTIPQDIRITSPNIIMQSEAFAAKVGGRLRRPLAAGEDLRSLADISVTRAGIVTVAVRARSPELAVEVANAYIEQLEVEMQAILGESLSDKQSKLRALLSRGKASSNDMKSHISDGSFSQSLVELALLNMEVAAAGKLVHTLDRATLGEIRQTPKRIRWVLIAGIFALAFSVSAAAYRSYQRHGRASAGEV